MCHSNLTNNLPIIVSPSLQTADVTTDDSEEDKIMDTTMLSLTEQGYTQNVNSLVVAGEKALREGLTKEVEIIG
jgi:hypothetical protein